MIWLGGGVCGWLVVCDEVETEVGGVVGVTVTEVLLLLLLALGLDVWELLEEEPLLLPPLRAFCCCC